MVLARPQVRNAQSPELLYALDDALVAACAAEAVRVIILAADGPDFSSGHDLSAQFRLPRGGVATVPSNLDDGGLAGHYAFECEAYLGLCQRWRDLPKPTIAQVQGRVIAGGLMLVWPLDIVIAAQSATFSDPVTAFGVNGVEYFAHVWELGHRKAREILFTGRALTATEAQDCGMVNHVVPQEDLEAFTLDMAREIAERSPLALRLAKESVNACLDAQGHAAGIRSAFLLHTIGHGANLAKYGSIIDPNGAAAIRKRR
ncbi:enoyl-CoA hydratase [Mycobacterium sp. Aquia_216]|uniref:enoyl-CoA hydratase n=1 Tax=Mycobacterium sp. Aquia_216 TaxID=2991729 RepID=UPI002DD652ED|nr:enoyl-CoA hydratase [Mycobacterium sp. Aquia_216]